MVGDLIRLPLVGKVNVWLYKLPPECLKLSDLNVRFSLEGIDFDLGDIEIDFWEGLKDMGKGFAESLYFEKDPEDEKKVILRSEGQKVAAITLESKEKAEELVNISQQTHKASFPVTGGQLKLIFPNTPQSRCDEVAALLNKYSDKFGINTPLQMAHFLGQVGHETGGFAKGGTGEWTCYKENGKWSIWFNLTWKETPYDKQSCPDVNTGSRKNGWSKLTDVPKKYRCQAGEVSAKQAGINLFSYVYRCEGGNGGEETQDGYKYRGHGFIHLTWKKQYEDFDRFLQGLGYGSDYKGILSDPDAAFLDMEISCLSGMWYWNINQCNELADETSPFSNRFDDKFLNLTKKINVQADQMEKRKDIFIKSYDVLK